MIVSAEALYKMSDVEWLEAYRDAWRQFARKGQELREMTRDLDLLTADVDIIAAEPSD